MKKKTFIVTSVAIFSVVVGLFYHSLDTYSEGISFESRESMSKDLTPVINTISFERNGSLDIWTMFQKHNNEEDLDEIVIKIDHKQDPPVASYYQLRDGKEIEYRVSCFSCHANGPRLIRANFKSKEVKTSLREKIQIAYWNQIIKHYGEISTPQNSKLEEQIRKVPLKFEGELDEEVIKLKSCEMCHGSESIMGRAELKVQHIGTIKFLVENGEMPPLYFQLSEEDREYLKNTFGINLN